MDVKFSPEAADGGIGVEVEKALLGGLFGALPVSSRNAGPLETAEEFGTAEDAAHAVEEIEPDLRDTIGDARGVAELGVSPGRSLSSVESVPAGGRELEEAATRPHDRSSQADRQAPQIDAGVETALLEGLSEGLSDVPEETGPPRPREDRGPTAAAQTFESAPGPEPGGLDAGLESVLLAGLSEIASAGLRDFDSEFLSDRLGPGSVAGPTAEGPPTAVADMDGSAEGDAGEVFADVSGVAASDRLPLDVLEAPQPGSGFATGASEAGMQGLALEASAGDEEREYAVVRRDGPVAALAFATDPITEDILREGLLYYESPSPGFDDAQVWPGGLRAAIAALADGYSTRLVIVDIDGVAFPAGAINELAEVCEVGTTVIAIGSDDSARLSRELLFAGVSDYLVKPITAGEVHGTVARAAAGEPETRLEGCVAGFVGTGGSGTSTVAAATALLAAKRGSYVSVLDLNRAVPAIALLLDVEPAPGLDQLLDVAGSAGTDPQMVDAVRAGRSDRVSIYAYRWSPSPVTVPQLPAVNWLLAQLRRRSQLVLVDGFKDSEVSFELLEKVDRRVVIVEPTVQGASRAARLLELLGEAAPNLLVQNHTRAFRERAGSKLLLDAGIGLSPDVVVPFEPSLPEIADRGWPEGRLPRGLRKPLAGLADRVLTVPRTGSRGVVARAGAT